MAEASKSDRVLELVKRKGPVIPSDISKDIGDSIMITSALLSELASKKSVRISHVKVGGTPLYYAPGQESRLQEYTRYLHEKEKKAYDMLKTQFVIRDKALEPVMRVALREIKDFAAPLTVQSPEGIEIFWKWYLMSNQEAEVKIKEILEEREEAVKEEVKKEALQAPTQQLLQPKEQKPKPRKAGKAVSDDFANKIYEYFRKNGIEIIEQRFNKKKTDAEFIVSVPSQVGSIKYYCKAKQKGLCNDADLSTAYVQGQAKKLPVLFLTAGKLTKKATQMLEKEFSTINVKAL